MANICTTNINIVFDKEKDAKTFYHNLTSWMKNLDGTETDWMEDIADKSHIYDNEQFTPYARGSLVEHSLDDKTITLYLECKWSPIVYIFQSMITETMPNTKFTITYTAEEPGMDIFYTNDPEKDGMYIVDCCSKNLDDVFYVNTKEEVEDILHQALPKYDKYKKMKLPELISEAQDKCMAYVHRYELIPIDQLD